MEKWVVGSAMRTYDRYEARDSYERAQDAMGENVRSGNDDIESNGRRFQEMPPDIATTMIFQETSLSWTLVLLLAQVQS